MKNKIEKQTVVKESLSFKPSNLLISKFCKENNIFEEDAKELFEETKKFLFLAATNKERKYSPSKKIDLMWHTFLLHSKEYFAFCETLGCFIHHQPAKEPTPQNYENTRRDMRLLYGDLNQKFWNKRDGDCSSCDCCPFV